MSKYFFEAVGGLEQIQGSTAGYGVKEGEGTVPRGLRRWATLAWSNLCMRIRYHLQSTGIYTCS